MSILFSLLFIFSSFFVLLSTLSAPKYSCKHEYKIDFCICFLFRPTVSTKYPLAQKWRSPYLYFKFACLSNIIKLLFPLRYPMICDTLYLGGILMSIWIWSGHACASIISTPFYSHNFLKICPISLLIWPYITILRYFGANAILFSITQGYMNTGMAKCWCTWDLPLNHWTH